MHKINEPNDTIIYIPADGNYIEILGHRIDGFESFEAFCEHLHKYSKLESRCKRFKNTINRLLDIDSLDAEYLAGEPGLTPNDIRYLMDLDELDERITHKKPPLGVEPEHIWMQRRIDDLQAAVERYAAAKIVIPVEWVRERNELISTLHEGGYW